MHPARRSVKIQIIGMRVRQHRHCGPLSASPGVSLAIGLLLCLSPAIRSLAAGSPPSAGEPVTRVEVISTESYPSGVAEVAIRLHTGGEEGLLQFSLRAPPADLKLIDIQRPRGLFTLTNIASSASGLIGIGLAPTFFDTRLPPGTNDLVIRYQVIRGRSPRLDAIPIVFDTEPFPGQCYGEPPQFAPLACAFKPGEVRLRRLLFEGDVTPTLIHDGTVSGSDWVRVGRAVAGLESLSFAEFEVADCAPRETRGDGVLSVADWVQAGRYYVGSDEPRSAGGPKQAIANPATSAATNLPGGITRAVSVLSTNAAPGALFTLPVQLDALGEENALGFSLRFDPMKLTFVNALASSWLVEPWLHRNTNNAAAGEVPVTLSLPPKQQFSAGGREVIRLMFRARQDATGTAQIALDDAPLRREVADVNAHAVPTRFNGGTVTFTTPSAAESPQR